MKKSTKHHTNRFVRMVKKAEKHGMPLHKFHYYEFDSIIRKIDAPDLEYLKALPEDIFETLKEKFNLHQSCQPKFRQKIIKECDKILLKIDSFCPSRYTIEELNNMSRLLGLEPI